MSTSPSIKTQETPTDGVPLPCPFCGGEAVYDQDENFCERVVCLGCDAQTVWTHPDGAGSKQHKIKEWNTRAAPTQGAQEPIAAALARKLCQLFDSGGESQRTVRARHASVIFQILNREAPEYAAEQAKCDADPVSYLRVAEGNSIPSTDRGGK